MALTQQEIEEIATFTATQLRASAGPNWLTPLNQAVATTVAILSVVIWLGGAVIDNQDKEAKHEERTRLLEYQATVSIADRAEMHSTGDRRDLRYNEMDSRLIRIETKLDQVLKVK